MSFRAKLLEHLTALPVTEVKKLVSKYNKELDIRPISKLKKAEILAKISAKKPMDKELLTKLTNEARATREGKKAQKATEKEEAKKPVEKFGTEKKKIKVKKPKAAKAEEPKKSAPKALPKKDAKAFASAFAQAPEEEKGSLFSSKPKKEKLDIKQLPKDIEELKQIIKKSYAKNKAKLSKMSPRVYEDTTEKKLEQFIEDAKDIYFDYDRPLTGPMESQLEKFFFSVVPKKQPKGLKGESATTKTTINPIATKIKDQAVQLLEKNKAFFENIKLTRRSRKGDPIPDKVLKKVNGKLVTNQRTLYDDLREAIVVRGITGGTEEEATRRAKFYLKKIKDELKRIQ